MWKAVVRTTVLFILVDGCGHCVTVTVLRQSRLKVTLIQSYGDLGVDSYSCNITSTPF